MERLEQIMRTTGQYRPSRNPSPGQGTGQQMPQKEHDIPANQTRTGQPLPRRSFPEPTTRPGQSSSYASRPSRPSQPQSLAHNKSAQQRPESTVRNKAENTYTSQTSSREYGQTSRQGDTARRSPLYQRIQQPEEESPYQTPRQRPRLSADYEPPAESARPKIAGDYYEDYKDYPPTFQADVQNTQNEWEDDAAAMRYGDWEDDGAIDVPRSQAGAGAIHVVPEATWRSTRVTPQPNPPLTTREMPPTFEGTSSTTARAPELRSPLTRRSRESQLSHGQPPAPEPPQQALPPTMRPAQQRMTQPLNPRTVIGVQASIPQVMVPRGAMEARRATSQSSETLNQLSNQSHNQSTEHSSMLVPASPTSLSVPRPHSMGVCPKCKGAGYLRLDLPFSDPHFGKPVPCECKEAEQKEKRRQQLLELSDLSAFQNRSFSSFNPRFQGGHPSVQRAYQEACQFAENPNGWLVLIGPNGCGKTHLAAAIANRNLRDGAVVLFTVVPDLLAHLRATFGPTATEAYDQRFAKMREAELLVLDDLGAHQSSPWANEKLFQLLNYRYNSCYPTVITANQQGLMGLDERVLSRISDTALVTTVVMNGAIDYRRQNPRREPMR